MLRAGLRKRFTFGIFREVQFITACQDVGILCTISDFRRDVHGTTLFWVITQRIVVICYRCFGTIYQSHIRWSNILTAEGCPETSVRNYHCSLRKNPEEPSSQDGVSSKCLGTTLIISKWHSYRKKIGLNARNASCLSVQNLPSYSLLSKSPKSNQSRNIIFCVVLHWHKILYLSWRERHKLRVFDNRVVRNRFGSRRDAVTGEWRRLHIEELHDLYCSPNIIWSIKSRRM